MKSVQRPGDYNVQSNSRITVLRPEQPGEPEEPDQHLLGVLLPFHVEQLSGTHGTLAQPDSQKEGQKLNPAASEYLLGEAFSSQNGNPESTTRSSRRSLALSPGWSAVAQSRLTATSVFPVSSNSPASASRVAGTTGTHHHVRLIFCTLVETGFHRVGQDGLDLLTS
ncbi:hypothetical protein AAY473_032796 [Plecturocebus cupreus]